MFMPALQTVLKLVYPSRCLICGGLVETDFGLCGPCWRDTPFISGLVCDCCGVPLIGDSEDAEFCDDCLTTPPAWSQGRAGLVYKDNGRKLVLMLKHGDRHDIALPAAVWMARQIRPLLRENMVAVPIPLHFRRHFKRRYNQSALLSRALSRELGIDHAPDALERLRHTASLEGKTREQRYTTLSDVLRVRPSRVAAIAGRPVLIVDDVLTSGATLCAATEACLAAGASEVCVSVLARVAKEA
ncbi:ComF family protein [Citreicella sp. C3M06]|uniref:ComF family protein n=1 Tax=Roseobacteraceae TaxID=2854170 RepID=UPI001C0A08DE|nr:MULTISPECIES: ComF family protein [Roseobacteraceae]MBU2960633.1 ComF family protein [Citreicella sp. C3M06]MDO6585964.1 ComF family protein [Salipiger sp. 1_MG-2023]